MLLHPQRGSCHLSITTDHYTCWCHRFGYLPTQSASVSEPPISSMLMWVQPVSRRSNPPLHTSFSQPPPLLCAVQLPLTSGPLTLTPDPQRTFPRHTLLCTSLHGRPAGHSLCIFRDYDQRHNSTSPGAM